MFSSVTATDLFSGAGGSSTGALAANVHVKLAINHCAAAIDSHVLNHPATMHDRQDLTVVSPSRYPRTELLLASPSCTGFSRAMNRDLARPSSVASHGMQLQKAAERERSRAHAWTVVEWAEHHRYEVVVVENVVEFALWPPFRSWLQAMGSLGYDHQVVSINAAFCGVPQSRDRLFIVFHRQGLPAPDLTMAPNAPCRVCGIDVAATQQFKPGRSVGTYGAQYVFVCPHCTQRVAPYAPPASSVLELSRRGERVSGRARPLASDTMDRITAGVRHFRAGTLHQGWFTPDRPVPVLPAFFSKQFRGDQGHAISKPLGAVTAMDHHALVHLTASRPSVATARLRMLDTAELRLAMGFPPEYQLVGDARTRSRLLGNAVCPPVMAHIVDRVNAALLSAGHPLETPAAS